MNKKILIIGILTVTLALGFIGYIYWTNKDAEVTQKPDAVEVNDIVDDKVATSTETANSDNKTVDNETAEALKAEKFFTDCLKVMNNINDTSNTEEMKPVREFMAENVGEDFIKIYENNYKNNNSVKLVNFNIKETKKGYSFKGYTIRFDYKLEVGSGSYEKTDAQAMIEVKDGKFKLLQFEAKE